MLKRILQVFDEKTYIHITHIKLRNIYLVLSRKSQESRFIKITSAVFKSSPFNLDLRVSRGLHPLVSLGKVFPTLTPTKLFFML